MPELTFILGLVIGFACGIIATIVITSPWNANHD